MTEPGKPNPLNKPAPAGPEFSEEEAEDIYKRAAEIHAETLFDEPEEKLTQDEIEENVERVGIDEKFVQQAIAERQEELRQQELQQAEAARRRRTWTTGAGVAGGLLFVILTVSAWRTQALLSRDRAAVETAAAQVKNVLQRRRELIPRVLAVVNASPEREQALQKAVESANLEKSPDLTGHSAEENALSTEVNRTLSELQGSKTNDEIVKSLLVQVEGAENRIAVERRKYNQAAGVYNQQARTFPAPIIGPMLGYPREYAAW